MELSLRGKSWSREGYIPSDRVLVTLIDSCVKGPVNDFQKPISELLSALFFLQTTLLRISAESGRSCGSQDQQFRIKFQ
jgi:hypothetical protein